MKKFSKKVILRVLCFVLAVAVIGTTIFSYAENTQRNIALKAAVYADTNDWAWKNITNQNLASSSINDGNTSTYFSSNDTTAQNTTEVVTMVFDKTYNVKKISLLPRSTTNANRGGVPVDFTLSVYDGNEWVEIHNKKDNNNANATYTLNDIDKVCSAVRLEATKLATADSKYALQLSEFEIWGIKSNNKVSTPLVLTDTENVAKDAEVDFDVPDWAQNDFPKTELTDGKVNESKNFATTTSLAENQKQEVYVTFDKVCKIDEISLYPAVQSDKYNGGFPVDYTLSVWNGSRWCEVGSEKGFSIGNFGDSINSIVSVKKHKFDVIETNAIRLTVDKNSVIESSKFALRLAEITANGVKTSKTEFNNPIYIKDYVDVTLTKVDSSDNKSLIYTFDRSYTVNEIVLGGKEIASFPKKLNISLWNGEKWQTVEKWDSFDITKSKLYIAVDGTDCRGIMITSNEELPDLDIAKGELKVRANTVGTVVKPLTPVVNAGFGATVETDTPDWAKKDYSASNLVNGSLTDMATTTYATSADTAKTVTFTFDGAYDIDTVNLYPRIKNKVAMSNGGYPVSFNIKAWNGTEWKTVKTVTGETLPTGEYPVASYKLDDTVACSAVMLEVTTLGASDNASQPFVLQLAEVEILGEKSSATITPPESDDGEGDNSGNTPTTPEGENAALSGTVSMKVPSWANYPAENLVDGSSVTFTTSEYYTSQSNAESASVVFKNGAYTIKTIMLYPRLKGNEVYGFPTDFTVSAWDGSNWVKVYEKTGLLKNDANPLRIDLDSPLICNAVKIDATKLGKSDNTGKPYTLQFAEIEAYGEKTNSSITPPKTESSSGSNDQNTVVKPDGENAALGGNATMEVPKWAENFPAKNLVDGSIAANSFATAEYYADQKTKESASVVFKNGAYTIKTIMLYPRLKGNEVYGFPTDFTVSAWDGSKWVEIHSRTGLVKNTAQPVRIDLTTPILCNAIKIDATKLGKSDNTGKPYTLQFAEIEAYGEKSSKTLALPSQSSGTSNGGGTVTLNNDGNLALNKPIKASSDLAQYNAPVTKANDGSISSYWATNDTKFVKGEPQWVEINLLNNYSVNKVVLGARQNALGFPYDFDIEVFYDGQWKKAHSVTGFEANEKAGYTAYEFTFPGVIGNKVRVSSANFRKAGSSNSMVLSEVAVYGDKVSGNYVLPNENMITSGVGISATSSMEDYDYYLAHLIDTNLTTAWSTVPSVEMTPQTVEVDMKCEVQLSEIQLKPGYLGYGFPIDFTISVCENGKWVDVYSAKDYKQPEDEAIQRFQFDKKNVTKFRITATKLPMQAGLYVWKMNEIIAYPLHTGDDFDPDATEITTSVKKTDAAEVIAIKGAEKLKVEISWWKVVAGSVLAVVAIIGCVVMSILFKKKKL